MSIRQPGAKRRRDLTGAADVVRAQFRELTSRYRVRWLAIISEIRIQDSVAYDHDCGWHLWKKTPRDGGPQVTAKDGHVDIWRKNKKG